MLVLQDCIDELLQLACVDGECDDEAADLQGLGGRVDRFPGLRNVQDDEVCVLLRDFLIDASFLDGQAVAKGSGS